jgi:hypothetical protein
MLKDMTRSPAGDPRRATGQAQLQSARQKVIHDLTGVGSAVMNQTLTP